MVIVKSNKEIAKMKKAGQLTGATLQYAGEIIKAGMTTYELDKMLHKFITSHGAKPSFLGYGGFPGTACISVNDEIIHGIPGPRKLNEGDIVSIDVGAYIDGSNGDSAKTFAVGKISDEAQALMDSTEGSLYEAIKLVRPGVRLGDLGYAIQEYNESRGFSVVKEFVGHGVGKELHEDPEVPNYGKAGHGIRLVSGMVIAIEPMINAGGAAIKQMPDGWTVRTKDGSLAAHFEHTIAITPDGAVILTRP